MAVSFCDTSALVKRYVSETGTAWVRALLAPAPDQHLFIVRLTTVELLAALARRERSGTLAAADVTVARDRFNVHLARQYQIIEVTLPLISRAISVVYNHTLRAYDAVQLAAALELDALCRSSGQPPVTLLSADAELNAAALAEGLLVENPNDHP